MDDPLAVRVIDRLGDLRDHVRDLVIGELGLLHHQRFQVLALDVLHRDEGDPGLRVFPDVVDRDDVGMGQDPGGLGLPQEPLAKLARFRVVVAHAGSADGLDGDHPPDDRILGEVHDAHRTLAELAQDLVTAEAGQPGSRDAFVIHETMTLLFPPRRGAPRIRRTQAESRGARILAGR